jgi:transcriptional regulator with XRE-family HTH domain
MKLMDDKDFILAKSDPDSLLTALSLTVKDRREHLELSQSELARRSGLHRSYIGDFEQGTRNISVKNLRKLAIALEVKASELLGLAENRLEIDNKLPNLQNQVSTAK